MVATNAEPGLEGLVTWQLALTRHADDLRSEVRAKQTELAQVEERLSLLTMLIEVETRAKGDTPGANGDIDPGSQLASAELPAQPNTLNLEDAVEEILRAAGEPLHISRIRETLIGQGVPIPGRGDDANIIVRLRRFNERFSRTARGTYSLAEWGIPTLESKTRKRRRSAAPQ